MITFSTAKQLKMAEFPYRISLSFFDESGRERLLSSMDTTGKTLADLERDYVPIPTLDDLFWALGKNLQALLYVAPNHWQALERADYPVKGTGTTSEDALAMLWLGVSKQEKQRIISESQVDSSA